VYISIGERLLKYGISSENAKKWKNNYNCEGVAQMHDNLFYNLLIKTTRTIHPKNAAFEGKIESLIKEKSNHS
jgi:hypothetical protein